MIYDSSRDGFFIHHDFDSSCFYENLNDNSITMVAYRGPSNLIRQVLKEAARGVGIWKSPYYLYLANQALPLSLAADLAWGGLVTPLFSLLLRA